jgi:hypothetical protein
MIKRVNIKGQPVRIMNRSLAKKVFPKRSHPSEQKLKAEEAERWVQKRD